MLNGLLLVVCVVLQFHYHDPIPWYLWAFAVIAQCVAFGEPAMRSSKRRNAADGATAAAGPGGHSASPMVQHP